MQSPIINRRIEYLAQLVLDIREVQNDIRMTGDPSLILEYEEEKKVLFEDLEEQAKNLIYILEAYFQDCKDENIPIELSYYKVYRELHNARKQRILFLD